MEKTERTEKTEKTEKLDKRDDINRRQKKNQQIGFSIKLFFLGVFLLAVFLVVLNWDKVIAPFKDAALDVKKGGFPVELPGSTGYVLEDLGENFCLMTDTYIYTYSADGGNIASEQHGFQNAFSSAGSDRLLVYDKGGRDFKCFSRTGGVFTASAEDTIVLGVMGPDERSAIVTTSTRFANTLYIYNGKGERIFRYYSPNKKIMQVCFSENEKVVYMTLLGEKGGELILSAARINISNDTENLSWETVIGSDMTYSVECCNDGVYVVTAGGSALLDKETGEEQARGYFGRQISAIPESVKTHFVIFRDTATNGNVVISYNEKLDAANSVSLDKLEAYETDGDKLYILTGENLSVYDSSLEKVNEYTLEDSYSDFKIINGKAYLLGYNTVQRLEL